MFVSWSLLYNDTGMYSIQTEHPVRLLLPFISLAHARYYHFICMLSEKDNLHLFTTDFSHWYLKNEEDFNDFMWIGCDAGPVYFVSY